jgi:hypothetical protein
VFDEREVPVGDCATVGVHGGLGKELHPTEGLIKVEGKRLAELRVWMLDPSEVGAM